MIIYFSVASGELFTWKTRSEAMYFVPLFQFTVGTLEIDEIQENVALLIDLRENIGKIDVEGLGKYYIDGDGDLAIREGWIADE